MNFFGKLILQCQRLVVSRAFTKSSSIPIPTQVSTSPNVNHLFIKQGNSPTNQCNSINSSFLVHKCSLQYSLIPFRFPMCSISVHSCVLLVVLTTDIESNVDKYSSLTTPTHPLIPRIFYSFLNNTTSHPPKNFALNGTCRRPHQRSFANQRRSSTTPPVSYCYILVVDFFFLPITSFHVYYV